MNFARLLLRGRVPSMVSQRLRGSRITHRVRQGGVCCRQPSRAYTSPHRACSSLSSAASSSSAAAADAMELSPDVPPLEREVRQLMAGSSAFDVLQDMCARAEPPVMPSPVPEYYLFNDGAVGAVRSALRLGSAAAMQVAHMQDRVVPLDEASADGQLPTVELFLERMAAHPRGIYDVRELEADHEGGDASLWPKAVRTHQQQCDQVLRLNFRAVQLLLWALAPPQGLHAGRNAVATASPRQTTAGNAPPGEADGGRASPPRPQHGVTRRLEHVWRKRGQQSVLKLEYGDGAVVVGQQSHGTTMVLDALQEAVLGGDGGGSGGRSGGGAGNSGSDGSRNHAGNSSYLSAAVPSPELQTSLGTILVDALLTSGPLLERRVSLGRATTVLHPFLVAWTQRNIIVDQIDQDVLRLLLSNFRALAENTRLRGELLQGAPTAEMCLAGQIPFDAARAWAGQWDERVSEFLRILSQATVAVATLMHMQAPGQALALLGTCRGWLADDLAFNAAEQRRVHALFEETVAKLSELDDDDK